MNALRYAPLVFAAAAQAAAGVPVTPQAGGGQAPAPVMIRSASGEVAVRQGASERWVSVAPGDALKPEDSIRLGAGASAVIEAGGRRIALPARVIVDIADLREMTRSDLLLRLAMEDVRSAPRSDPEPGGTGAARTTTTRATGRDNGPAGTAAAPGESDALRLAGTAVLFEHGFYATCVLRSRQIFRTAPELEARTEAKLRMAESLERMSLAEEARETYASLAAGELSPAERRLVESKLESLKR